MKYKLLKFNDLVEKGSGAYGIYYRIGRSQVGVKVFDFSFEDLRDAQNNLDEAKHELKILTKAAERTTNVPNPVGLAIIKDEDEDYAPYRVGYMMSHVVGKPVEYLRLTKKLKQKLYDTENRLERLGIELYDNHSGNVMLCKDKFIFVDAGRFKVKQIKKKVKAKRKVKKRR